MTKTTTKKCLIVSLTGVFSSAFFTNFNVHAVDPPSGVCSEDSSSIVSVSRRAFRPKRTSDGEKQILLRYRDQYWRTQCDNPSKVKSMRDAIAAELNRFFGGKWNGTRVRKWYNTNRQKGALLKGAQARRPIQITIIGPDGYVLFDDQWDW